MGCPPSPNQCSRADSRCKKNKVNLIDWPSVSIMDMPVWFTNVMILRVSSSFHDEAMQASPSLAPVTGLVASYPVPLRVSEIKSYPPTSIPCSLAYLSNKNPTPK